MSWWWRVRAWIRSSRRYGVRPRTRRRRAAAERARNDELNEVIASVVTLLRGSSVSAADEAESVRARIRELKFNAFEANVVLDMVVGYSTLSLEEFAETVMWHRSREEGL
jgi:hypothetical protein